MIQHTDPKLVLIGIAFFVAGLVIAAIYEKVCNVDGSRKWESRDEQE